MICEHASASRMTTYESCPLRYYSRYELGIRGSSTIAIDSGLLGHNALEEYYTPNNTASGDECFSNSQTKNRCADKNEYLEAQKMFFDFINSHPREQINIIGAEVGFKFFLESGSGFLGYIDRVDLASPDTVNIVDYKTGKFVPTYAELKESHQTNLYPLWIYRNPDFAAINHVMFTYHYVRSGETKEIYVSRDTAFEYQQYADHLYHAILSDNKPEPRLNGFCYNCDYRGQCPAYQTLMQVILQDGTVRVSANGEEVSVNGAKFGTFAELVVAYDKLGVAERSIKNEKQQIGSMLTNALKYSNVGGTIVGDKQIKIGSKEYKKCSKMSIRRIAKKYGVQDEVLKTVTLKALEETLRGNAEAMAEITEASRKEQSRPYPVISKARVKK